MSLKNYLLTFIISTGLIACNSNDEDVANKTEEGIPTYVSFSIHLPGGINPVAGSKALPEDYNPDGTYEGNDGVQTLDIYMRSGDGTIEAKRFSGTGISSTGTVVSPSEPFRTTSGVKTVYIVLNSPQPLGTTITQDNTLVSTDGLAEIVTENGVDYDVITMTGKATSVTIEPDIPSQSVVAGGSNHVSIQVTRMASRIIVTSSASNQILDDNNNLLGTVSNITYSVAQGTKEIYFLPQTDYVSYGYDYVPELGEYVGQAKSVL